MQSIFTAFIVIFGVIAIQPNNQLSAKAVTGEVTDGSPVEDKLRNLFDSIKENDIRKTRTYRDILGKEAAREQQVFDTVKEELRFARQRNAPEPRNLDDKNGGATFKREAHENKNGPNNIHGQEDAPQQCKQDSSMRSKRNSQNTTQAKYTVVMVRHGESLWNLKNLFSGWFDTELSEKGVQEAIQAGRTLRDLGFKFDVAYSSVLSRARGTLFNILEQMSLDNIPVNETWRLNERHYGSLTGLNKAETALKYGEEQVQIWRRSYDVPPPPMGKEHTYYGIIVHDPRYFRDPEPSQFPHFESLKMTTERTLPYWNDVIVPQIKSGKRVLIVAHGNSLRGIVKYLDNRSEEDIMTLNLPTGVPFLYEFDENLKPVTSLKFLGDENTVAAAMAAVAAQGKAG